MNEPQELSSRQASRGTQPLAISCAFMAIALVVLLLRVITRTTILKTFGLEDYVMVLAFVSTTCINGP